uniref:Glutathione S-transferase omega n=1 Tax=Haplochromis burtoni TaxID=8153 RepID=A0A3Q3CW86_HAPBU
MSIHYIITSDSVEGKREAANSRNNYLYVTDLGGRTLSQGYSVISLYCKLKMVIEGVMIKACFVLQRSMNTSVIYESPITCEYLDEVYPEKKLLPSSPFAKAQQKMMLEHFSKVIPYFYKIPMDKKKGEDVSGLEAELKEKFDLVNKKTKFFGGDSITMIDYMMWPWFERVEAFLDGTPELKKWTELMLQDSAVKALMFSPDAHKAFFKTFLDGNPDFDYGL